MGDFNNDGKLDIARRQRVLRRAGLEDGRRFWRKPRSSTRTITAISFCNFAEDVNGDGRTDLVVVDFPGKQTWWFEQPEKAGTPLKAPRVHADHEQRKPQLSRTSTATANASCCWVTTRASTSAMPSRRPRSLWKLMPVSAADAPGTDRFSHGIGAGDINRRRPHRRARDRRLVGSPGRQGAIDLGVPPRQFRRALLADVRLRLSTATAITTCCRPAPTRSAFGGTSNRPTAGKRTKSTDAISQTHSLCLADINGDKLPDFVTGKRWWAHGPKGDARPDEPAVVFWFELTRKTASRSGFRTRSITTAASARNSKWPTSTATGCSTSSRPTRRGSITSSKCGNSRANVWTIALFDWPLALVGRRRGETPSSHRTPTC